MSNDLNLCQFIGHVGRDPETRYTAAGDAVTNFSLGVGWKTKDKEGTEWVRCTAFGKVAEIAGEYLRKGKQCYVAGRMSTRKWTDKDGQDKWTTEINVDRLQLLGGKDGAQEPKPQTRQAPQRAMRDDDPNEIPF